MWQQMCQIHQKYIEEISGLNKHITTFQAEKKSEVERQKDIANSLRLTIKNLKKQIQDTENSSKR